MTALTGERGPVTDAIAQAVAAARRLENPAFICVVSDAGDGEDAADARGHNGDAGTSSGSGSARPPLDGLPFAVKDNIDVAGLPTTAACPTLDTPATRNAQVVERLVGAGARPIGKTNMDQFATGLVGTRSPYGACHCIDSPAHVSGGSSSGSAIAVASGVVPFALGTDTAGSGRVPAAFNAIVGIKPTRGLVSTRGVLPACASLDCVSIFSRSVELGARVLEVIAEFDPADPYSRVAPSPGPAAVAREMRVVGIPAGEIDLDVEHRAAWTAALTRFGEVVHLVPVDVEPMLAAARLLYEGAFVAERLAAFGHHLEPDGPHLDPTVRRIVLAARAATAADLVAAQRRLASLTRASSLATAGVDAVLLPTTPGHPTLAQVRADPVGVNARLGTFTNMANLLDLCAVALPAGRRADGLPFGVQLLAPAFADGPLLELAGVLTGETARSAPRVPAGRTLVAVCGAHLSGQPLNHVLTDAGGRLNRRAHTAPGYRLVRIEASLPKPGLVATLEGRDPGVAVEVWDVAHPVLERLSAAVEPPLRIGSVALDDGTTVAGYIADAAAVADALDITASGGWRAHLAQRHTGRDSAR